MAVEVLSTILRDCSNITGLDLLKIEGRPDPTPLQTRLGDKTSVEPLLESGKRIRQGYGFSFFDAVLISCFGAGVTAYPILENVCFHNTLPAKRFVPRDQWPSRCLDEIAKLPAEGVLVVSSRVRLMNGEYHHIPMLDFHCPASMENQIVASRVASLIDGSGGYLLRSGRSYHYYGKALIAETKLPEFLGRSLLFGPILDRRWVAHQLMQGECGLRISAKIRGVDVPQLVEELQAQPGSHP
jgi:hypothetical protein